MANKQCPEIDREKVRERIDNFIQNDGQVNIYVKAPSSDVIARDVYSREVIDKKVASAIDSQFPATRAVGSALFSFSSKPSTYPMLMSAIEMNRVLFRASYQYDKLNIQLKYDILQMLPYWRIARDCEDNPPKGIIGKLFSWTLGSQEYWDKCFLKNRQKAYEWLQEGRPLEQCDIQNKYAILGINLINRYNQRPEISRKVPLDEFVAEQIRRVPEETIDKSFERELGFKWVNGERIVDMNCTLGELYC